MFGGLTIQAVFLVVIGAALLVTGTSGLRRSIRMKKAKSTENREDSSDQSCGKAG